MQVLHAGLGSTAAAVSAQWPVEYSAKHLEQPDSQDCTSRLLYALSPCNVWICVRGSTPLSVFAELDH